MCSIWFEQYQSWEPFDLNLVNLIGSRVELGNPCDWVVGIGLSQLLPSWFHPVAVTTSWGIEHHESIVLAICCKIMEVFTNNSKERTIVNFRGILALIGFLSLARQHILSKLLKSFNGHLIKLYLVK
jgi:hypothetical protein